jgi:hypothetical protein
VDSQWGFCPVVPVEVVALVLLEFPVVPVEVVALVLLEFPVVAVGDPAQLKCPAVAVAVGDLAVEAVELEEEAVAVVVAVPLLLLLLPQAARITVNASKRKVTLINVFNFSDSDFRTGIFFTSFYVYK